MDFDPEKQPSVPTTTTGDESSGNRPADDERDDDHGGLFHPADAFRDWATPEEMMQMRTMWADVLLANKVKVAELTNARDKLQQERDHLLHEVKENQQLREMYIQAQREYEQTKVERNAWKEERATLILQLQAEKLQRDYRGGSGGGHGGSLDSATSQTQSSTSTVQQAANMIALNLAEENLALHEQLRRAEWSQRESQHRMESQSSLGTMTLARLNGRIVSMVGEVQVSKSQAAQLKDSLLTTEHKVHTLEKQLAAVQGTAFTERLDCHRRVEEALVMADSLVDHYKMAQGTLTDEMSLRCHQLQKDARLAAEERAAAVDQLNQNLSAVLRQKDQLGEQHALELEQQATVSAKAVAALKEQLVDWKDHTASLESEKSDLTIDRETLDNRVAQLDEDRKALEQKVESQNQTIEIQKVDLDRYSSVAVRLELELQSHRVQEEDIANTAAERDALVIRLGALEAELEKQRSYYEKQSIMTGKAIEMMQKNHDEKCDMLLGQVMRSEEALGDITNQRSRDSVGRKKRKDKKSPNLSSSDGLVVSGGEGSPTTAAGGGGETGGVDVLEIMRGNAALARKVSKMVDRTTAY